MPFLPKPLKALPSSRNLVRMSFNFFRKSLAIFPLWFLLFLAVPSFAQSTNPATLYWAIPLSAENGPVIDRYGVPFEQGTMSFPHNKGPAVVKIGGPAKRIFLLGMTDTGKPHSWTNLHEGYARRYFIGDEMGSIRVEYTDGSAQTFPLVFGESLWWGTIFYANPEPYFTDAGFRKALGKSLRLYPAAPVNDGNYVAVIVPKNSEIKDIVVKNSPVKVGVPVITGITVESGAGENIASGIAISGGPLSPDFEKFAAEKSLCAMDVDTKRNQAALENLKRAFYVSDANFKQDVAVQMPPGYSGPTVTFTGSIWATILANVFYANVQDIRDKITDDGMYHTSTKGAPNWSLYSGFGTYQTNLGCYYKESWSRDMGRSLQELTALDYTNEALRCADYCIQTARLWEDPSSPKFDGQTSPNWFIAHVHGDSAREPKVNGQLYPPHWGRIANKPQSWCVLENDGHGLISMFLYRLWLRLPDRDEWLRARWPDVKAAGDWVLWQFAHPEVSGATNGILFTTSEASGMVGYSVYPDYTCINALRGLAEMAESIGETNSAAQWRDWADKMQTAIAQQYTINDPKYGRVWTLRYAGWPNKSTVLGPLVLLADYEGFAPEDDDPILHPINEAAYQRLVDTYRPFGFYGLAMGYGQGIVTQSALLLDRMHDATKMLDWSAKEIYDPRFGSYITPEACDVDPTGRYLYRMGDLGNGVQEAEIVKMLRLVIGVDDTKPDRLQFYPRMPYDWNEITVTKYPVLFDNAGENKTAFLSYHLKRVDGGMELKISTDRALGPVAMRLGPFEKQPEISKISINGQNPTGAVIEHSGDSWWVRFIGQVGVPK